MTATEREAGPPDESASLTRRWEGKDGVRLRGVLLFLIADLAGLSYAWALNRDPLEPYYEAAVRSMAMSWHNFVFGALDPAGTITVDKLPGAFWVQALAVRAFGFHSWAIVAPQVIEGVLTVLVLYRAVCRLAGPAAGLVAAFVLAVSPATVALNRGNISDSLMIVLLVLAADAVSAATATGRQRSLILAAVWVGLAFQAKMIEAWLVLPALGLAYLLSGPGSTSRRLRQLAVAAAVAAVMSLAWITAVSLVPAANRPAVDGSSHNSLYQQVFVYNGFGRFGQQTPLQLLARQSLGVGIRGGGPAQTAGPERLLRGDLGRDTGWLLPAAAIVAVVGLVSRRGQPRRDRLRACFVLWGAWLLILGVTFSAATMVNVYYTAALTPAIAAIIGAGVAAAWSGDRGAVGRRVTVVALVAITTGYAVWLLPSAGTHLPGWLRPAALVVSVAALAVAAASCRNRTDPLLAAVLGASLLAAVVVPTVASVELVANHEGAFDTPFESRAEAAGIDALFIQNPANVKRTIPVIEAGRHDAPYLLATQTSALASVFIDASGQEALPIGGFDGTNPAPTLSQIEADVRAGTFNLVIAAANPDPRLRWIATHCLHVGRPIGNLHSYYCTPSAAG